MVTTDAERTVVGHLYENLMKLWPDAEGGVSAIYGMAKSSRVEENDDGTVTYVFTLRNDITWSDGQSVTAQDFVYAWQRLVDPETNSPNAALLNMVAGYAAARKGDVEKLQVTAPDENTLQVVLSNRCPYFLSAVCTAAATMPVREDISLTNGAYRVTAQTNDTLTAKAVDDYYDSRRIGPRELRFDFCPTPGAAAARCQRGSWDVVLGLTETQDEHAVREPYPEVGVLVVNQMAQSMASESLRQAMSMVIDRNAMAQVLGSSYAPADGLIPSGIPTTQGEDFRTATGPVVDIVADDYEKTCAIAREMMTEAGFEASALAKLGTVTLRYENTPAQRQAAQLLQSTWQKELGLTVTLAEQTAEEMDKALEKGEITLALTTVNCDRRDAAGYLDTWRSGGSENYANFHSSAYDMLLRVSDASQSDEARDAYLKDAERLLLEKGNVVPLYFTTRLHQVDSTLTGLFGDGMGIYCLSALHVGT